MNLYHIVNYAGPFGFIKPWTAVRDGETFSQQFLTPSILEGIEKKLFPELLQSAGLQGAIIGHRLSYLGFSPQQEVTWSKEWVIKTAVEGDRKVKARRPATGILMRNVLIEPHLFLAFSSRELADRAAEQHICLCRNEDVLLPVEQAILNHEAWEEVDGFELDFSEQQGFKVGHNRFNGAAAMYGVVKAFGNPVRYFGL